MNIITEHNVQVPVRDGTILRANVFRPNADRAYPGLLLRTPYGKPTGGFERFVRSGYVVVTQDSRGRYDSDGDYVPFTVEHTGDAEDGYDSVEWLSEQPWCNGRVGTMGASYNAWMQWQLAKLRPPHLEAMCAYTIPLELTEVDYPGGFRPGRRIRWWLCSMAPDLRRRHGLGPPHTKQEAEDIWETEHGRWLGLMPWKDIVDFLPPLLAENSRDWLANPTSKPWQFDRVHQEVEVPNLDFSGWYDHCNGTMAHLQLMQKNARTESARNATRLIIGPWNHGGLGKRRFGDIDFGPEAEVDLQHTMIRWFDRWLKDLPNETSDEPAVRYFVMGPNKWRSSETWPPTHTTESQYFLDSCGNDAGLSGSGTLDASEPAGPGSDEFTYDPRDPVPTLWSRTLFTEPSDRRKLEHRKDILYYRTSPLTEDVEVVGYPEVILYASSSCPDTDFFARLVDEHPGDGPAIEVCYGMIRARHRNGLDVEELLKPNAITEFRIRLGATANRFRAGHRIRLEITSSDFPNHDRNHNVGRNDLEDVELQIAHQRIHHGAGWLSKLILPIDARADTSS
jgi:putative CocE/NonD family hydrolase